MSIIRRSDKPFAWCSVILRISALKDQRVRISVLKENGDSGIVTAPADQAQGHGHRGHGHVRRGLQHRSRGRGSQGLAPLTPLD